MKWENKYCVKHNLLSENRLENIKYKKGEREISYKRKNSSQICF